MGKKITIIKIRKINSPNINQELQWVGNSLGLFNVRDRDSSCFRVFITLVRRARQNKHITSDEIADKLNLSRGTVVHHLAKLMDSGIVLREKEGYILRESNIQDLVKDLHHDMERMFSELKDVAKEIDLKLG
jgi:predicted transcriptional regulator